MRVASAFLILVGLLWAFSLWWLDAAISGIAERTPMDHFYWRLAGVAAGPILLILGPLLLIRRTWRRPAAVLAVIGCSILTFGATWGLIDVALHENASNRGFGFSLVGVICVIAVLADLAAVRICRVAFRRPI